MASLVVVTAPDAEPLTLDEAKKHLRVTASDDDDHINFCIRAARRHAENFLNRALITQTLRYRMDSFPDLPNATAKFFVPTYSVESYLARAVSLMSGPIYLPRPPLLNRDPLSVTSITYVDQNGVTQTLASSAYLVDADAEPARIAPAYSTPWPVTRAQIGAVSVTYKAGYGEDTSLIPENILQAVKILVAHFYEFREPITDKTPFRVPMSVEDLLWMDRDYEVT